MNFKIVNNAWWMFWARGMVLWPWMWLREVKHVDYDRTDDVYKAWYQSATDRLYRHELQHCYQVASLGRLKFYSTYIWYQIRYGYKKNPFEVEANQREDDPLNEDEIRWREQGVVEL